MTHLFEPLQFRIPAPSRTGPGRVWLVGAGPGDPDLLTVKAARLLRQAQVVLYDHLVGPEVLELVPHTADRIDVGKSAGRHTLPQAEIGALMVGLARAGRSVLRLKGGDPYIFGRGGEEAEVLAAAGIAFEVVPGISAAQGAAAVADMPLTHRDHAASVVFASGHLKDGCRADLDWPLLARPGQTVVIYMGVAALSQICCQLVAHGLPATTPAAVVERATLPEMRTIRGTLATLPGLATVAGVASPAVIVVGGVVGLHAALAASAAEAAA